MLGFNSLSLAHNYFWLTKREVGEENQKDFSLIYTSSQLMVIKILPNFPYQNPKQKKYANFIPSYIERNYLNLNGSPSSYTHMPQHIVTTIFGILSLILDKRLDYWHKNHRRHLSCYI